MYRTILASLVLAMTLSFAATAEDRKQTDAAAAGGQSTDANATADNQRDAAAADAAQPAAARDSADAAGDATPKDPTQAFVMEAYVGNLFEIQAGQWVAEKAQDDQVKQFARMLVKDHQQANQQLKQIAQSGNIPIQEKLDTVHQAKIQKMQKCPASELSRKFAFGQVAGHTMNVLEYQYQSQNAQNDQVKQYATQTLPKLQQHLQHATQLAQAQMGGAEARPAGERLRGGEGATGQQQQPAEGAGASDRGAGASDRGAAEGAGTSNRNQSE